MAAIITVFKLKKEIIFFFFQKRVLFKRKFELHNPLKRKPYTETEQLEFFVLE